MRGAVLSSCSPVLEGFLDEGDDTQARVIGMEEFELISIKSFLKLAMITSHESTAVLSIEEIVKMVPDDMPLIHKYDTKGILCMVKSAINSSPTPESVMAVVKYTEDDGIGWMQNASKVVLMKYVSSRTVSKGLLTTPAAKVKDVPPKAMQELFLWAMTECVYEGTDGDKFGRWAASPGSIASRIAF